MPKWVRVCRADEIADGAKAVFEAGESFIVICRVGDGLYAVEDCCTHDGGPLGEGPLEGFQLTCPRHGAKFDIRDGRALTMPATRPTRSFALKVENGEVFVQAGDY